MVPCQRAGSSDTEREVLTAVRTPCCLHMGTGSLGSSAVQQKNPRLMPHASSLAYQSSMF
jgi:hypothetical protein